MPYYVQSTCHVIIRHVDGLKHSIKHYTFDNNISMKKAQSFRYVWEKHYIDYLIQGKYSHRFSITFAAKIADFIVIEYNMKIELSIFLDPCNINLIFTHFSLAIDRHNKYYGNLFINFFVANLGIRNKDFN